jgi:hypothetical protein
MKKIESTYRFFLSKPYLHACRFRFFEKNRVKPYSFFYGKFFEKKIESEYSKKYSKKKFAKSSYRFFV